MFSFRPLLTRHLQSYLAMNLLFYGLIGVGMLIVLERPELQRMLLKDLRRELHSHASSLLVDAYLNRHVLRAACLTFAVNLVLGTALEITFPSLFIPFIGLAIGMVRALLWGLTLGPGSAGTLQLLTTTFPVMLLEGQAYVLAMLGVYLHGKAILIPASVGAVGRWQAYKLGLAESLRIYLLIVLVLAVAAIYEAAAVIAWLHRS